MPLRPLANALVQMELGESFLGAHALNTQGPDDATMLLSDMLQRGREDLEGVLSGARNTTRKSVSGSAERVLREVDRARRAAGVGPTFPILGYDDLTAAQVTERLGDLSAPELRKVRDYEKRNANRKSVLAAVEQKLK